MATERCKKWEKEKAAARTMRLMENKKRIDAEKEATKKESETGKKVADDAEKAKEATEKESETRKKVAKRDND